MSILTFSVVGMVCRRGLYRQISTRLPAATVCQELIINTHPLIMTR